VRRAALLFFALSAASCHLAHTNVAASATPVETADVGRGVVLPTPTLVPRSVSTATGGPAARVFVLHVVDQNGGRPQGIPARFDGPAHLSVQTDATGDITLRGREGTYSVHIDKGCHPAVVISQGVVGTVHLLAGAPPDATVHVTWRHRFAPSGVSSSDAAGDWTVGTDVHIRYDIVDRCANALAPNARYPTFAFRPSANVRVVGAPRTTADGSGRGSVTARCTSAGEIGLRLVDTADPPDAVDLLSESNSYSGRPRCT
jgi:hypothetical protein